MKFITQSVRACILIFLALVPLCAEAQTDTLLAKAREDLQAKRFAEAANSAVKAVDQDPEGFVGHYYLGCAYLGLKKFSAAEDSAIRAYSLAPATKEETVKKLLALIREEARTATPGATAKAVDEEEVVPKAFVVAEEDATVAEEAEQALDDGLTAKAAELYEKAWQMRQTSVRYALQAADLYANRLKGEKRLNAAKLYREVLLKAKEGSSEATVATRELKNMEPVLEEYARNLINQAASTNDVNSAKNSLFWAKIADPSNTEAYHQSARIASLLADPKELMAALKEMSRRGMDLEEAFPKIPRIASFSEDPKFCEFVRNLTGHSLVVKTKTCSKCDEGRVSGPRRECSRCGGAGADFQDCPPRCGICKGKGKHECWMCKGKGTTPSKVDCESCKGRGFFYVPRLGE